MFNSDMVNILMRGAEFDAIVVWKKEDHGHFHNFSWKNKRFGKRRWTNDDISWL